MRALCLVWILLVSSIGAAQADCLPELEQFREQVNSLNQARPTPQTQAALRELRSLERNEMADEIDCYNTLATARAMLTAPYPPLADDRYAKDRPRP
jgi:hypothetical protein